MAADVPVNLEVVNSCCAAVRVSNFDFRFPVNLFEYVQVVFDLNVHLVF